MGPSKAAVRKQLKKDEISGLQNGDGVKLIKWKDKRDALMITIKPSHTTAFVHTRKTTSSDERIVKPKVDLDYNNGRRDTNLSDKLSAYYTCLRRSIKWYQKLAFELILGPLIANTDLICKENYATCNITILQLCENLVQSLLFGVPSENLKPSLREQSINRLR